MAKADSSEMAILPTVMNIATTKLTHIMCTTVVLEPSLPLPNSAAL